MNQADEAKYCPRCGQVLNGRVWRLDRKPSGLRIDPFVLSEYRCDRCDDAIAAFCERTGFDPAVITRLFKDPGQKPHKGLWMELGIELIDTDDDGAPTLEAIEANYTQE